MVVLTGSFTTPASDHCDVVGVYRVLFPEVWVFNWDPDGV
jgi:hypothetical protein